MLKQDAKKMKRRENKWRTKSLFILSIKEIFRLLTLKEAERENICEKKAKRKLEREAKK